MIRYPKNMDTKKKKKISIKDPRIKDPGIKYPRIKYPRIKYPRIKYPRIKYPRIEDPRTKHPWVKYLRIKHPRMKHPRIKDPVHGLKFCLEFVNYHNTSASPFFSTSIVLFENFPFYQFKVWTFKMI